MISPATAAASALDFTAAARWPVRAAAHVLGAGLVIAVVIALPAAPTDLDRHQLPKETVVHLATWLAVLLARPLPPRGMRPATLVALTALLLVVTASSLASTNGWLAFRAGSLFLTAAAALITARHVAALGAGPTLLIWCGIAGITGAGTGLAQAYGLDSPLFAPTRLPGGTFGNRNFMAHFSGLALPVLMMTALATRRRAVAIGAMAGSAILAAAIVLTRSRAAWLGTGTGTLIFLAVCIAARRRHALPALRSRVLLLAGLLAVGIVAARLIPNRLSWRSASPYTDTLAGIANHDDGSGRGRMLQYRNTLHLTIQHPLLGIGPGNWPIRYAEVAPPNDPSWVYGDVIPLNPWPSSDWIALLSEIGVTGTLAALLLGLSVAWRGAVAARASGERVLAGAALLATLAVAFIEGSFDAVLLLPVPVLFLALSAGTLIERADERSGAEPIGSEAPRSRWALLLPLVLGVVVLRSVLQTTAYMVAGNGRSLARLSWAAHVDPGSYPLRIALAQRMNCSEARNDVVAALRLAPNWPAAIAAAHRCGVRVPR